MKPFRDLIPFFVLLAIVLVLLYFFMFRSEMDMGLADGRLGPQFQYTSDQQSNGVIDGLNLGIDQSMQSMCAHPDQNKQAVAKAVASLPPTCTSAFNSIPGGLGMQANIVGPLRKAFCNQDDTFNKPAVQKFLNDMNTSLCPY